MTDRYAVFGYPVGHSKSPLIHREFARQTKQDIDYQAIEVKPGQFVDAVGEFCKAGAGGFNITLPFKKDAWQLADRHDRAAKLAKAVNCIRCETDGTLSGFNTDGTGLIVDLRDNHGIHLKGKKILILGAGGSAAGILGPIAHQGPAKVVLANRTPARALELVDSLGGNTILVGCGLDEVSNLMGQGFDLIINATSASLQNTVPDLPAGVLATGGSVYDLMYSDQPTPFVNWGLKQGAAQALDGLGMLVEQAAEAFYIWRGVRPQTDPVIKLIKG